MVATRNPCRIRPEHMSELVMSGSLTTARFYVASQDQHVVNTIMGRDTYPEDLSGIMVSAMMWPDVGIFLGTTIFLS